MKKKIIKFLSTLGICTLLFGTNIVHAASVNYSATVPVINDFETSLISYSNGTYAGNSVSSVNGKLSCWVEKDDGKNCSARVAYNATGYKDIKYGTSVSKTVKLNISTASTQWSSVSTTGIFYS